MSWRGVNGDVGAGLDPIVHHGLRPGLVLQLDTPVAAAAPWLDRISFCGRGLGPSPRRIPLLIPNGRASGRREAAEIMRVISTQRG